MVILSKREIMKSSEISKKHCFDIVFEWEDILAEELKRKIINRTNFSYKFDEVCRKIYQVTKIPFYRLYNLFNVFHRAGTFIYDVSGKKQDGIYNNSKYIPCIIDFFYKDEEYPLFLNAYGKNDFVLVTNKEVYEYLRNKNCPIKIYHFPLSLPDYMIDMSYRFEKKYDLILFARQNPLLLKYVDEYEKKHEDFTLVRRRYVNGHFEYYLSSTGEIISRGDTRDEYWNLVKMSRVALYTTPSIDGTRKDGNGWNQVTPHFLEEIAGQCHIIARYPDNEDTRWYELDKMCKFVDSYIEFESFMDEYRKKEIDLKKYKNYLKKHSTSVSAEILKNIMLENKRF